MQSLRTLADDGRTVVVVTHSVANLDVCDFVLMLAPGGYVAYFGPPGGALAYFGKTDFADVFLALEATPGPEWDAAVPRLEAAPGAVRWAGRRPDAGRPAQYSPAAGDASSCRPWSGATCRLLLSDKSYTRLIIAFPLLARNHPARGPGQVTGCGHCRMRRTRTRQRYCWC